MPGRPTQPSAAVGSRLTRSGTSIRLSPTPAATGRTQLVEIGFGNGAEIGPPVQYGREATVRRLQHDADAAGGEMDETRAHRELH